MSESERICISWGGAALRMAGCVVVVLLLVVWGCESSERTESVEASETVSVAKPVVGGGPADNAQCLVCHADFRAEFISARHEKAGLACTGCHGDSVAHGGDEFNVTTPDRLFGRAEIVGLCRNCHPSHKTGKVYGDFLKKWDGRRRVNGRMVLDDSVCTDCHGNHAILLPDQQEAVSQ